MRHLKLVTLLVPLRTILPNGMNIPWASRDGDSPDVIYGKNMFENMLLAGSGELLSGFFALRGGNKIVPKNDIAAEAVMNKELKNAESSC